MSARWPLRLACVALATALHAQTTALPGAPPTGPAHVWGIVVDDVSGRPLRRVHVSLAGMVDRETLTDEQGRFAFASLPFGQFTMTAARPAYVTVHVGARGAGRRPGRVFVLTREQPSRALSVRLPYGAAVTGRVVDLNGQPAQNVRMMLLERQLALGEQRLAQAPSEGSGITDDRGVFRLYGIVPGEYLLAAIPQHADTPVVRTELVDWAREQGQTGAADRPPPASMPPSRQGPSRTFYPGSIDVASAFAIPLRAGEVRAGLDFALQYVPKASIAGVVVDPAGGVAASAQLTLLQRGLPSELLGPARIGWTDRTRTSFRTSGLPTGAYTILATAGAGRGRAFAPVLWGMTDVTLAGEDVSGAVIALQPTLTLAGSLRFASEHASLDHELDVALAPDSADGFPPGEPRRIDPAPNGSFVITGLLPGTYRLVFPTSRPGASSSGWWLDAALLAGRDVSDRPFAIGPADDGEDLLLTFSDRAASFSGRLLSANERPVSNMTVVLFSVDRSDWGLPSRRNSEAQPDASGEFTFGGLPAGEYYVAAVQSSDPERTTDPDPAFYEELVSASVRLALAPGEHLRRDLRLASR